MLPLFAGCVYVDISVEKDNHEINIVRQSQHLTNVDLDYLNEKCVVEAIACIP